VQLELISRAGSSAGSRPALLFIHGAFHGAWCWDEHYLPYFRDQGWAAHALSLRGHGGSDGADGITAWTLADYADDVVAAMERIGAPVILVGHSMGGVIAQQVWRREPARVAGMVLLASSPLRADPGVILRLLMKNPVSLILGQIAQDPKRLRKAMTPFFLSPDLPQADKERYHALLSLESPKAVAEVFSRDRPQALEGDTRPVLVVAGRDDWSIPLKAHKVFVETYGAEFAVCPGYHGLMLDPHWRTGAERIAAWLERFV